MKKFWNTTEFDLFCSECTKSNGEQFQYGFCFESCDTDVSISDIANYLADLCYEKSLTGKFSYTPCPALERAFRYDAIVKRLAGLAHQLFEEE